MLTRPFDARFCFTYRCNLKCPFCYERFARNLVQEELPLERWLQLIRELKQLAILKLTLIGGEPFCHPYMEHFLDELTNAPIRFDVGTNGTLLDDAWIRKLKQTNRCAAITLSLDGFKDYHDSIRGNGTFEAVLNAIHKLCDAKIKTSVNVVVSQDNYTTMPDFAQFLESLPITAYTLYTRADQAHGENALGGELSITELAHFIQIMDNLNLRKINKDSTNLKLLDSLRNPPEVTDEGPQCLAPKATIGILPNGDVPVCASYDNAEIAGNVKTKSIAEAWNNDVTRDFIQQQIKGEPLPSQDCLDCVYRQFCRKSCPKLKKMPLCRRELAKELNLTSTD